MKRLIVWCALLTGAWGAGPAEPATCAERVAAAHMELKRQKEDFERQILAFRQELGALREQEHRAKALLNEANVKIDELRQLVREQKMHIASLNNVPGGNKSAAMPCDGVNPFPKLLMKEEALLPERTTASENGDANRTIVFKASAFRLNAEAEIYDKPFGRVVDRWEAGTSFTSNRKREGWIRITGYFVDRQWRPNRDRSMWVRETLTTKR